MKKIAILSTVNIKHMTLISLYTDFLKNNNIDFDIIYIDKYNDDEITDAKRKYKFNLKIDRDWNVLRKLFKYFRFRKYAKKVVQKNKYDFIIVWNSFTGLMFFDLLTLEYHKKYSLNIRDYANEKNIIIYFLISLIVKCSAFTTISSEGFRKFLPKHDYVPVHSFNSQLLSENNVRKFKKNKTINITFIGYVRFFEMDKKLIKALGNDERFKLYYIGEGSERLQAFAEKENIKNVECHGRFEPSETIDYLENTDIINNLYGTNTPALKYALSIKLYYAVHFKIPILVFNNTFMEEIASEFNFSIPIESLDQKKVGDYIYNKYNQIEYKDIEAGTKRFKKKINQDNNNFYNYLKYYLK